jgi:hypothetical protein
MGAILGAIILVAILSSFLLLPKSLAFGLGCVASLAWASENPGFTPMVYVIGGVVYRASPMRPVP